MAKYKRGDVVMLNIMFPPKDHKGVFKKHPFLIINSDISISEEADGWYTGVMLTHSPYVGSKLGIKLDAKHYESGINQESGQIRCHIISSFSENEVSTFINRLKPLVVNQVIEKIKDYVLN